MAGQATVAEETETTKTTKEQLQDALPTLFKQLDKLNLLYEVRKVRPTWGRGSARLYIYEPGQFRLVNWHPGPAYYAKKETKLYKVFTPPTRYTLHHYTKPPPGGMVLINIGFTLGVERGSRGRAVLSMPNGGCRGAGAALYWPSSTLAEILTDYWHRGFNLDNGYPRSEFFRRLRYKTHCSAPDIFAAWEKLSEDEVMELVGY